MRFTPSRGNYSAFSANEWERELSAPVEIRPLDCTLRSFSLTLFLSLLPVSSFPWRSFLFTYFFSLESSSTHLFSSLFLIIWLRCLAREHRSSLRRSFNRENFVVNAFGIHYKQFNLIEFIEWIEQNYHDVVRIDESI